MRFLDDRRIDDHIVERPEFAAMIKRLACHPRALEEGIGFLVPRRCFGGRHSEPGKFIRTIAFAHSEIEAAVRQLVDRRDLFGEEDRVVPWQDNDTGAEANAFCAGGKIGQQRER